MPGKVKSPDKIIIPTAQRADELDHRLDAELIINDHKLLSDRPFNDLNAQYRSAQTDDNPRPDDEKLQKNSIRFTVPMTSMQSPGTARTPLSTITAHSQNEAEPYDVHHSKNAPENIPDLDDKKDIAGGMKKSSVGSRSENIQK